MAIESTYDLWKIIVPASTINYVINPSFEGATSANPGLYWNSGSLFSVTSSSQLFGRNSFVYSYRKEQVGSAILISSSDAAMSLQPNANYVFSAYVHAQAGWSGSGVYVGTSSFPGSSQNKVVTYEPSDVGSWKRIYSIVTTGSNASGLLQVAFTTAPSDGDIIRIDGVMVEPGSRISTYVDGDQPGCYWNGYKGRSTSERYDDEPRGGYVYSFANDLSLPIGDQVGIGAAPVQNQFQKQSITDGLNYQGTKLNERNNIVIAGTFSDQNTRKNLHARRADLIRAVNARTRNIVDGPSLRRLIYTGASTAKYFDAAYAGGLELSQDKAFTETIALKFTAPEPVMYGEFGHSKQMNVRSGSLIAGAMGRIGGQWSNLGIDDALVNAMEKITSDDKYVYFSGNWSLITSSSFANLVQYERTTGSLSLVGGASPNGTVRSVAVHPNGDLYIVGSFTAIAGVPVAGVAKFNGSTWSAVGGASSYDGLVWDLDIDSKGRVWIVGDMVDFDGNANSDGLARFTPSANAWTNVGTGIKTDASAIVIDANDNVYITGGFASANGVAHERIVKWNETDGFVSMGTGLNNIGRTLAAAPDGAIYVGGDFTQADGKSINYLAKWNGVTFEQIGNNDLEDVVFDIDVNTNGELLVGGRFADIGGNGLFQRAAIWNGSVWSNLDVDIASNPYVGGVHFDKFGNIFIAPNFAGDANYNALTTVNYTGTEYGYPVITIDNSLENTVAQVSNIESITAKAKIYLDFGVAPGDVVDIDFRPKTRGIRSKQRGSLVSNFLPNSDVSNFVLLPSNHKASRENVIGMFVTGASPSVFISWQDTYNGVDD